MLTTALEPIAPIVRWGYLFLNHADNAPGYDPPIVIQGFYPIPCSPNFLTSKIKYAKSLSACYVFRYLRFTLESDLLPKGMDYP